MARKDRTGNRKTREQRKQFKVPELGYYLIVTGKPWEQSWQSKIMEGR